MKYDVVVIGGGIIGSAIIHSLSRYNIKSALVEKEPDLCEGTSKANSAILHTGFDAPPGTIEAEALKRSRRLWPDLITNNGLLYEKRGAVMVATDEEEERTITEKYIRNAELNDVDVRWISKDELHQRNPVVTDQAIGGLLIEDEAIIDPWNAVYRLSEVARQNGANILLNKAVRSIDVTNYGFTLNINEDEKIETKYLINAAGLFSDNIAGMISDESFNITPRKGQFIVTKEKVDITNIILPVPTKTSKGKLITPAVFKGHLLGPTAEDIGNKKDRSTTESGFEEIREGCRKLIPESENYTSVKQYAGLRSVCSEDDFVIRPSEKNPKMIHAAGIRSTGLSAAPGVAEMIVGILKQSDLTMNKKTEWKSSFSTEYASQPDDEEIICLTRNITKGQIREVLSREVTPKNIDGIKRRTTALLGECQGSCCLPKILDIILEMDNAQEPIKSDKTSMIGIKI